MTTYFKSPKNHKGELLTSAPEVDQKLNTALASKADTVHTHTQNDVSGLQTALDAKASIEDVQREIGKISGIWTLKGRLDNLAALNAVTGMKSGWVYLIGAASDTNFKEYVYTDANKWEELGYTTSADLSNYFTKSEVNAALTLKADASNVYTKAETDSKLSGKVNTADVYGKSEIDTKLSAKADTHHNHVWLEMLGFTDEVTKLITDNGVQLYKVPAASITGAVTISCMEPTALPIGIYLVENQSAIFAEIQINYIKNEAGQVKFTLWETGDDLNTIYGGFFASRTNKHVYIAMSPKTTCFPSV